MYLQYTIVTDLFEGWSLSRSLFNNFQHNTLRSGNKNVKAYPDFVPYSHDPPGHTCGLPCCSEDLQIQLRVRRQPRSCISIQENDIIQQNFTFRGRQPSKLRPILENGFYSVQQPREVSRAPIPKFGSLRADGIEISPSKQTYRYFPSLKQREITLPELRDPKSTERLYLQNFHTGESDDLDFEPDEIEYYLTHRNPRREGVPYNPGELVGREVFPWSENKEGSGHIYQKAESTTDSCSSNYYEVLSYPEEGMSCKGQMLSNPTIQSSSNSDGHPQKHSNVPLPSPPKLPVQNTLNHPPLPKPFNASTLNQRRPSSDGVEQANHRSSPTTKYNTYNTVYSLNSLANKASQDAYERYLSFNRAILNKRQLHRDIRELDFSGKDVPDWSKQTTISSLTKAKLNTLLKKNETIADSLKSSFRSMGKNSLKVRTLFGRPPFIYEEDEGREFDEKDVGIDNAGFKHVDIDGKLRHDVESHYSRFDPLDLGQKIRDMDLRNPAGPIEAQTDNPITLIL